MNTLVALEESIGDNTFTPAEFVEGGLHSQQQEDEAFYWFVIRDFTDLVRNYDTTMIMSDLPTDVVDKLRSNVA